ncbi:MAG: hypothetical protein QOF58_3251 [Pseudonocardiales bacterium]|nr:hypothetical protein [Pseudonocardiales bacterium]
MRVGTGGADAPPPHTHCCADERHTSGEGQARQPAPISESHAGHGEQPPGVAEQQENPAGLIGRITSSWPSTLRVVTLLVVVVVLVTAFALIVPADIELGPVKISPH